MSTYYRSKTFPSVPVDGKVELSINSIQLHQFIVSAKDGFLTAELSIPDENFQLVYMTNENPTIEVKLAQPIQIHNKAVVSVTNRSAEIQDVSLTIIGEQ